MPQMKPMLWSSLLCMMILVSFTSIILIHFFFLPMFVSSPPLAKNSLKDKMKFIWQW